MRVSIPASEQGTEYELAFPGTYPAVIAKAETKTGPKGRYIEWQFDLQNVQQNAEGGALRGRVGRIYDRTTLIEGQRWRIASLVKAAGFDPLNFDTEEMIGRTVLVDLEVNKDEGYKPRNEIKKYKKA
jgi:hypothetical protein